MGDCPYCNEPIAPTDMVVFDNFYSAPHKRKAHYECSAYSTVGSVGHQKGKCFCYGGTEEDPPGLTRRQAAQAALAYAKKKESLKEDDQEQT